MKLNQEELLRYSRHLPIIGKDGQEKLKSTTVLSIGAGGLGAPVLQYLVACGVGTIGIVDGDRVELSNLQRQVLFNIDDVGKSKTACAAKRLNTVNPAINVIEYHTFLSNENAARIIQPYDIIMDCTDNYKTRYLVNDMCLTLKKPFVSASIHLFQGQCSVFNVNQEAPCYRCLYEEPPSSERIPSCATTGVLGVLPGLLGTIQAAEAIKLVLKIGQSLAGRLLVVDMLKMTTTQYSVEKNPTCSSCQHPKSSTSLFLDQQESNVIEITPRQLSAWLFDNKKELFLLDVRQPHERDICDIGGTLIPLMQLPEHIAEIPKDVAVVIYCKSGRRSKKAAELLQQQGYQQLYSLQGGILQWISDIDPSLSSY